MAVTQTVAPVLDDDTTTAPEQAPAGGAAVRVAAVGLWCVVGTLLGYGVLQTALKAVAIFG